LIVLPQGGTSPHWIEMPYMDASRIASRICVILWRSRLRPYIRPCLWIGQVTPTLHWPRCIFA